MLDYHEIGNRIRKSRKEKGLSQEELAEKNHISITHMSHIETGSTKVSLPVLVSIAASLEKSTDEIILGEKKRSKDDLYSEFQNILDECSQEQILVLEDVLKSTKSALDKFM